MTTVNQQTDGGAELLAPTMADGAAMTSAGWAALCLFILRRGWDATEGGA